MTATGEHIAQEIAARIAHLQRRMTDEAVDAAVITSPENVQYFCGANIHTQRMMRRRQAAVVVPCEGCATLIVAKPEAALVGRESPLPNVTYDESCEHIAGAVAQVLLSGTGDKHRVWIEDEFMSVRDLARLEAVTHAAVVPCDATLELMRSVKSDPEREILRRAAEIADAAILAGIASTRCGQAEYKLSAHIVAAAADMGEGSVTASRGLVASGENLFVTHHVAGPRILQPGDVVRVGCHVVFAGYQSLVARTAVVVNAPSGLSEEYDALRVAHEDLIASLRDGISGEDVYRRAAAHRSEHGRTLGTSHVGHGMGIEFQEPPHLRLGATDEHLRNGMVVLGVSVMRHPEFGDLYLEDVIRVDQAGGQLMSSREVPRLPLEISR